jgi:hypothetical protein
MIGERMKASVLIYFAETDRAIAERIRVLLKYALPRIDLQADDLPRAVAFIRETIGD